MSSERPMSLKELAAHLKAAPSTLSQYVREGMGEACGFKIGKQWRILPGEAIKWLRDRPARKQRETAVHVQPVGSNIDMARALSRAGVQADVTPRRGRRKGGGD